MINTEDIGDFYRVKPDLRDLNYDKFVDKGEINISELNDYNSQNTTRLRLEELKSLLMGLDYIQSALSGDIIQQEG